MYRKQLLVTVVLMALCLVPSLRPVFASVGLVYFKAEPHSGNTILLTWETATELGTVGFRVYRSQTPTPASWGEPITAPPAQGNAVTGGQYAYEDTVTPGVMYYYLLREVTSGGEEDVETASAGIGVATPTPTPTATATASRVPSATWTRPVSSGSNPIPTPTTPPPTATRQYTNTPAVSPVGTATPQVPTSVPFRTPTPTPLPPASVASPTGHPLAVTAPPTLATASQPIATIPTEAATFTLTPDLAATEVGPLSTATPRPTKDVTPIIFAAEMTPGSGSPTPSDSEEIAGQGSRSGTMALMVGGSALGLAGLLVALFLFLRSRKS